jgi:hypothetical protein
MKAFQIFSHPFAPVEPFHGYMQRIRDMAEEYTLIAPQNFMGPRARFVPISEAWAQVPEHLRKNTNGPRMEFDAMRVRYLTQHFDQVYLDLDVELFQPIELGPVPQMSGSGVLAGNGDSATAAACWETYLRMCPSFCRPASLMFSGGAPVREVPEAYFKHWFAQGEYF